MPTRECPICRKTVRTENIEKHYENVHPGKTVPANLLKAQEQAVKKVREARRVAPVRRPRGRPSVAIAVIALILLGIVGGAVYMSIAPSASASNVVTYCGGEGTAQHYHVLLVVNANGQEQDVPANIGITDSPAYTNPSYYCTSPELHALHTHDGSGIIHLELPGSITATPTLGDFFSIWGKPLLSTQAWSFSGPVKATLYNMAGGTSRDYSGNPQSLPLAAPAGGVDAYSIPSNWIHNGQFGSGDSNGVFSGQIVFLNVTR